MKNKENGDKKNVQVEYQVREKSVVMKPHHGRTERYQANEKQPTQIGPYMGNVACFDVLENLQLYYPEVAQNHEAESVHTEKICITLEMRHNVTAAAYPLHMRQWQTQCQKSHSNCIYTVCEPLKTVQ